MNRDSRGQLSRRQFNAGMAVAGFAVLGAGAKASAQDSATDVLKVGVIGCGGRGTGAAYNAMQASDKIKIVALGDAFEDRVRSARVRLERANPEEVKGTAELSDETCFVGLDAYEKVIAQDVDIIIHGAVPYCRPAHLMAAAKAGKHIFTEKPVAVDPVGIREVMEAAKICGEKGTSFVAGTQRRHQKAYVETIKQLQDGAIGDIVAGRCYWCGGIPFVRDRKDDYTDLEYRLRNWISYNWTSGSNIVEQHIHNIDVINWVMGGPPREVFASGGRAWIPDDQPDKHGDIFDHFTCDFKYENGVQVTSFSRWWNDASGGVFEEVVGTKGKSNCRDMAEDDADPYVQEHADLVASITGEGPYLNEGQRVAESVLTAIMGRMSAYTGQAVTYREALKSDLSIVPEVISWDAAYPVGPPARPGVGKFA